MTTPPKPTIREIEAILMKYLPIASIPTEDWNSVVKELSALLSPQTGEGENEQVQNESNSSSIEPVADEMDWEKEFEEKYGHFIKNGFFSYEIGVETYEECLAFLRKHLSMQRERIEKKMGRSTAFCTCGDALLREDDTYYCIGCDKTYVLSVQKGEK